MPAAFQIEQAIAGVPHQSGCRAPVSSEDVALSIHAEAQKESVSRRMDLLPAAAGFSLLRPHQLPEMTEYRQRTSPVAREGHQKNKSEAARHEKRLRAA
jgi:hypothetical protein